MDKINKILETQEKAAENKKHQGSGMPQKKLPNKQHSTNK